MSQLLGKPPAPKVLAFAASTIAAVAAAVDVQVASLNLLLVNPAFGPTTGTVGTPGSVVNGSISVSDITQFFGGNAFQYICTVHWTILQATT